MERVKRWHLGVIAAVVLLTIYNILPTIFYYSKPLNAPIDVAQADKVRVAALERVNALAPEAIEWLGSFNRLLGVKATEMAVLPSDHSTIEVTFLNDEMAEKFQRYLPRAGSLIPFLPAQLALGPSTGDSTRVFVKRQIPVAFTREDRDTLFRFSEKWTSFGEPTPFYREVVDDRLFQLITAIAGPSEEALYLQAILANPLSSRFHEFLMILADRIIAVDRTFKGHPKELKAFYQAFTRGPFSSKLQAAQGLKGALVSALDKIRLERIALEEKAKTLKGNEAFLDQEEGARLQWLKGQEETLTLASRLVKDNEPCFASGPMPLAPEGIWELIAASHTHPAIALAVYNPIVSSAEIDWNQDTLILHLAPALIKAKAESKGKENLVDTLLFTEMARLARDSGETLIPLNDKYEVHLSSLTGSQSFLALDLRELSAKRAALLKEEVTTNWQPTSRDLSHTEYPIIDWDAYQALPLQEKKLCLVFYDPLKDSAALLPGFRQGSLYVIARGVQEMLQKFQETPNAPAAVEFFQDFSSLSNLLKKNGFFSFAGNLFPFNEQFSKDVIFEASNGAEMILKATREDFHTFGTHRYALLEFSNVAQRMAAQNRIDNQIHEDLLRWKDDYHAAEVDLTGHRRYDVPKPTQSPLWSNLALSTKKYFRGDERKILHWGLDLSGGKTVQIELFDAMGRPVKDEASIKQGINELYRRVNKMGVSEVTIRQEDRFITLDFPGAQHVSAGDLIKASSMYFHIVNEAFGVYNPLIAEPLNQFLQEVWNEAVVTNRKDSESVNLIAWDHLYGKEGRGGEIVNPRSRVAKILYDKGLRLAHPFDDMASNAFNDAMSKVAIYRGNNFTEWHNQTHPLLIVFNNYALEGSNLDRIYAGYDPSKGNILSFEVKGSQVLPGGEKINPKTEFHTWTSAFAKDKILGTSWEQASQGHGWRMAIVLNGTVISAPELTEALRGAGMISGSFSQREVNQLEADLKAGSLTFTPHILSEKNVSPELGLKDRTKGVVATFIAIALVFCVMTLVYRFFGFIASCAVFFNLFIMWAVLQNIQATLTLASIAALILNVGMAVDANVLVFERVREEFKKTGRLALSISLGYKKAFSAIVDSNITTLIAALILLHFDSGPIKGFAVTLIIGILSSMFSALFLTRVFFAYWVQNPAHKDFQIPDWLPRTHFNFLKYGKPFMFSALAVVIAGLFLFGRQREEVLGMDFTGGYALTVILEPQSQTNYRALVESALLKAGATRHEIAIRELTPENCVRIFLSRSMALPGRPFASLPMEEAMEGALYLYENNPRIAWVVHALEQGGLVLTTTSKEKLTEQWTSISGQMSDTMRKNALWGLAIALLCIFVYIAIRFEFKYAVGATVALFHDVFVTLAVLCFLNLMRVPVQIDLNTIAALMTIVGYSLNDTIIVFDRIREELKYGRKISFHDLINGALNTTLSRTFMTSATTFVVLLALVLFAGASIFSFSLTMMIGIIVGTISSLYVASPIALYLQKKEGVSEKEGVT